MNPGEESLALPVPPVSVLDEVRDFLEGLRQEFPQVFPAPKEKSRGRAIPFRGRELMLSVLRDEASGRSLLRETVDGLEILRSPSDERKPQDLLREWYSARAEEIFSERTAFWAGRMGLKYARVQIRDQRTLWGSCSPNGTLSFNWRVVMAPPEVLDYLVIHELAHLLEMNHSRRFWRHVAARCPDFRAHRKWLRDHARDLKSRVRRGS